MVWRLAFACLGLVFVLSGPAMAEDGDYFIGDADAPVEIIEYSSLTCPHCANFHRDSLPALKRDYIDTGKVKLILRDFPLDRKALEAAAIAECLPRERYAAFIDVLFLQQSQWRDSADHRATLKQFAAVAGLPADEAQACLEDTAKQDAILQERLDGQNKYGIRSTPSFIVNGKLVSGNQTPERFAAIIDPLLDE